jgi:MFS transporter, DHA1 family, multidrug resistance protein
VNRRDTISPSQVPVAVLVASFLFNLGQGVLRPALPLYLEQSFAANYRMVTLIPVVFGAGRWVASLPTGYLLDRLGRRCLMIAGLLVMAGADVTSAAASLYGVFLALRALGGVGWAMFGTVATTAVVSQPRAERRGRAISLLLMSETLGLLFGSTAGGVLYQVVGTASPFFFEAACTVLAAVAVAWQAAPSARPHTPGLAGSDYELLRAVWRVPGVLLMSLTSGALIAIQTGILVFLYPLFLAKHGRLRPESIGYLVSLSVLGRLLALWLGGNWSDRWGRAVIIPGLLAYGAVLGSLTLVSHPVVLGAWSLMIGGAAGFVATIPTAVVGDRVSPPLQAIAIGWLRAVSDSGFIVGPLVFGALADATLLSAPFVMAAAILAMLAWHCRHLGRWLPACADPHGGEVDRT